MKFILSTITLLMFGCIRGQVVRQRLSINYATAGAYSKNFLDIFSGASNQAAFASLKTGAFGAYGERRFMLQELSRFTSLVALPTASGTFGFQADYFGSSSFNETEAGIMYARKLSATIDIGGKFNYHLVKIAGYASISAVNFEGGAIIHLTERLHTGIHVYNPGSGTPGKTASDKLASVYSLGLGYEVSDKLFIGGEIIKHEDENIGVKASLQYSLEKSFFIRTGISTINNNSFASAGLNTGFGRIDLNIAFHPQLGFTPGILLSINFKKSEEE